MNLTSWILRKLSNDDNCTDLIEYVLIASLMILGVVATCDTLTTRISMEFTTIASRI
ncbi:MAG: Flp family type IVb pilin [Acidobacteriaceae bacterium]